MPAYTSPERVERDGFLIAFKGETMTETEARKRGLLATDESAPVEPPANDGNAGSGNTGNQLSKAEVKAELESRGIKYNSRTSEKKLRELLAEALAAEAEKAKDAEGNAEDGNTEGDGEDESGNAEDGNTEGEAN